MTLIHVEKCRVVTSLTSDTHGAQRARQRPLLWLQRSGEALVDEYGRIALRRVECFLHECAVRFAREFDLNAVVRNGLLFTQRSSLTPRDEEQVGDFFHSLLNKRIGEVAFGDNGNLQ